MLRHILKNSTSATCFAKESARLCTQPAVFSSQNMGLKLTRKVARLSNFKDNDTDRRAHCMCRPTCSLNTHGRYSTSCTFVRWYGTGLGDPGPDLLSLEGDPKKNNSEIRDEKTSKYQKKKSSNYNQGLAGKGKVSYSKFSKQPSIPVQGEILFGIFPVLLALREGRRGVNVLHIKRSLLETAADRPHIKEIISLAEQRGIEVISSDVRGLNSLSGGRPHQGVCLDADRLRFTQLTSQDDYQIPVPGDRRGPQLWLVLDSIQDPMNFGAILRSSYFLGVDEVITVRDRSCPPSPVVSKASAGVLELRPIWTVDSILPFIQHQKTNGWHIVGTVGSSEKSDPRTVPLSETSFKSNTILLMGNEGKGLDEEVESLCDCLVTIRAGRPLVTNMESLNVSVATGIVLHHLLSHREK